MHVKYDVYQVQKFWIKLKLLTDKKSDRQDKNIMPKIFNSGVLNFSIRGNDLSHYGAQLEAKRASLCTFKDSIHRAEK